MIRGSYDVVVVGGGMSGLCAAIAASRHGARTCLVQNRPVLGGNASSEIRMHICGALGLGHNRPNARETGILEEIMLENQRRNPQQSFSIFDTILWEKTRFQEGLELLLNTHVHGVECKDGRIRSLEGFQLSTEKTVYLEGHIVVDATGDGTVAALAGAQFMRGREGRDAFGERHAPESADNVTMGSTLLFSATDLGLPVSFERPRWANTFTEEDLAGRDHEEVSSGYWWIEVGGEDLDTVSDGETIRDELLKAVYGIWDHLKNSGHHDAERYALDWVGFLPGKRESRRVVGDYVLREQDLLAARIFPDAVAFGGWPIDLHTPKGIRNRQEPTTFIHLDDLYTIPYRSLVCRDVANLLLAGRAVSASHVAFASLRVMGTCAVMGQAAGTAAALAVSGGLEPRGVVGIVPELQQMLADDDCHIPGYRDSSSANVALEATASASSSKPRADAAKVVDGHTRGAAGEERCWVSSGVRPEGEWVHLALKRPASIRKVRLLFDSDLSRELMLSLSHRARQRYSRGVPEQLVRDYRVELLRSGRVAHQEVVTGNYLRFRTHEVPAGLEVDAARLTVLCTNGDPDARVFEVRLLT